MTTSLNDSSDTYLGGVLVAVFGTGVGLAVILVTLRIWTRIKILRKTGADDWTVIVSLILTLATFILLTVSVHYGLGRHLTSIPPNDITPCFKGLILALCITGSAEAFAKFSISLMLCRITTSKKWRWFFYTLMIIFSISTLLNVVADLTRYTPTRLLWDFTAKGHCRSGTMLGVTSYVQGVAAAVYDIILATSPIILLRNVMIDRRKKIALCALLALGFFTSMAGILRTVYTPGALIPADLTYTAMLFLIWKSVELPLSIIVGCIPPVRPLAQRISGLVLERHKQRSAGPFLPLTNLPMEVGGASKKESAHSSRSNKASAASTAHRSGSLEDIAKPVEDRV